MQDSIPRHITARLRERCPVCISDRLLHRLEMVQRSAARVVLRVRRGEPRSITASLFEPRLDGCWVAVLYSFNHVDELIGRWPTLNTSYSLTLLCFALGTSERQICLNCGYFGYFRSQKYLRHFRKLYSISFCYLTFKMSSSRRFFTTAEAARQFHEYANELDDVDSDIEREVSWCKFGFNAT